MVPDYWLVIKVNLSCLNYVDKFALLGIVPVPVDLSGGQHPEPRLRGLHFALLDPKVVISTVLDITKVEKRQSQASIRRDLLSSVLRDPGIFQHLLKAL